MQKRQICAQLRLSKIAVNRSCRQQVRILSLCWSFGCRQNSIIVDSKFGQHAPDCPGLSTTTSASSMNDFGKEPYEDWNGQLIVRRCSEIETPEEAIIGLRGGGPVCLPSLFSELVGKRHRMWCLWDQIFFLNVKKKYKKAHEMTNVVESCIRLLS